MSEQPPPDTSDYRSPESAPRSARRSTGLLFAATLIVLGAALLATNLGIITLNWNEALRYWPVLLILLGLDILIGRRTAMGGALMALLTVAALGGVLWLAGRAPAAQTVAAPARGAASGKIEESLGGASKLKVKVSLSTMAFTLGAQSGGDLAAQGEWTTDPTLSPDITYEVQGDTGLLTIRQPEPGFGFRPNFGQSNRMTLNLPRNVPIELSVDDQLGATQIDLAALNVSALDVASDSGSLTLTLPEAGQMQDVTVRANLGSVTVTTPDKATLNIERLDVTSGSGSLTLALPGKGTINDLTVKGDLGSVTVSVPDDAALQLGSVDISSGSGSLTVALPAQGKAGGVMIKGDLGSVSVAIPGASNTFSVDRLDVRSGSGALTLTLPAHGNYEANIQGDLGRITLVLPAALEAHVDIEAGLSEPVIRSARLNGNKQTGWETSNYKEGQNRALVSIKAGSGGVEVTDQ